MEAMQQSVEVAGRRCVGAVQDEMSFDIASSLPKPSLTRADYIETASVVGANLAAPLNSKQTEIMPNLGDERVWHEALAAVRNGRLDVIEKLGDLGTHADVTAALLTRIPKDEAALRYLCGRNHPLLPAALKDIVLDGSLSVHTRRLAIEALSGCEDGFSLLLLTRIANGQFKEVSERRALFFKKEVQPEIPVVSIKNGHGFESEQARAALKLQASAVWALARRAEHEPESANPTLFTVLQSANGDLHWEPMRPTGPVGEAAMAFRNTQSTFLVEALAGELIQGSSAAHRLAALMAIGNIPCPKVEHFCDSLVNGSGNRGNDDYIETSLLELARQRQARVMAQLDGKPMSECALDVLAREYAVNPPSSREPRYVEDGQFSADAEAEPRKGAERARVETDGSRQNELRRDAGGREERVRNDERDQNDLMPRPRDREDRVREEDSDSKEHRRRDVRGREDRFADRERNQDNHRRRPRDREGRARDDERHEHDRERRSREHRYRERDDESRSGGERRRSKERENSDRVPSKSMRFRTEREVEREGQSREDAGVISKLKSFAKGVMTCGASIAVGTIAFASTGYCLAILNDIALHSHAFERVIFRGGLAGALIGFAIWRQVRQK